MQIKTQTEATELSSLKDIFSPLKGVPHVQVFVHGSWADNTRTAFSDLDDFVVVDSAAANEDEKRKICEKLHQIELHFQHLDPLQHHGHWQIDKCELANYNNSYIPLFILENAVSVIGSNELSAAINKSKTETGTINNIIGTCKNIERYFEKHEKGALNIYELKCFVGSFALISPLIFQLKGEMADKRSAILRANEIFSEQSLMLIQWATDLRNNWNLITDCSVFETFKNKLKDYNTASDWRKYAADNAPVIDYSALSEIKLNHDSINNFINEVIDHIDQKKYQIKTAEDYKAGYQLVEKYAIENNALIVGQFGSIKWPSISDLDVFICFKDEDYKEGVKLIDKFIEDNELLSYLFTHPPVYVSASMLPYVEYLHTLNDLTITHNIVPDLLQIHQLDEGYQNYLNIVWSFLFLYIVSGNQNHVKYFNIRQLVLLLKNVHTSIKNIEKIEGLDSGVLEVSNNIRTKLINKGITSREEVLQAFEAGIVKLYDVMALVSKRIPPKQKMFVYKTGVTFYYSKSKNIFQSGDSRKIYLDSLLFNTLYDILVANKNKETKAYVKAVSGVHKVLTQLNCSENPFAAALPYIQYLPGDRFLSKVKHKSFFFLNMLPSASLSVIAKKLSKK